MRDPKSLAASALAGLFLALAACGASWGERLPIGNAPLPRSPNVSVYQIEGDAIPEASGLARSHRASDILWIHNDSGGGSQIYAISTTGQFLGMLRISDAASIDWEDIASFVYRGTAYLMVGDIGDNFGIRPGIQFYVIEEPDLSALRSTGKPFSLTVSTAWQFSAEYPDGPRDCEGLAVDAANGRLYLLTKRDTPPRLYSLPLLGTAVATADLEGEVATIPPPTQEDLRELFGDNRNQPTALDFSPGGDFIYVVTYKNAYRYVVSPGQSWIESLAQAPAVIELPQLPQTEAGTVAADQRSVFAASERLPAALVQYRFSE